MREKREEIIELPEKEEKAESKIKIEKVIDIRDTERVIKKVLEKKVVLVNLKGIKNISDYQNVIKEFKRFGNLYKLNLILIDDNYLLLTTKDIKIEKI
ncbi:MAG: cell division protein SepF [Candidatus Aenigmarchaeota archaeon]|nr:cell division protein SepF [Candidatus Aenigmarchaeota archaeon]